ncbi:MAG: 30S ribosomal protein S2 [bacterium]|nr:MAG: 30S ribosomal protein S2 [bacterium]
MVKVTFDEMLEAGVHFGHLKRKWNPSMAPYIFMERNGIHIIDLYKTQAKLEEASAAMKQVVKSGRRILFVSTKKQAKDIVSEMAKQINMPYVTERWPGGMLTNFATIRKAIRKMTNIDKLITTNSWKNLSKRERLQVTRERAKLEKNLGSIADMARIPAALFIVDINKEKIAVAEARKLNIPIFAMVDTNTDPNLIDFPIPANDDASKSITLIMSVVTSAVAEGLAERKMAREKSAAEKKAKEDALAIAREADLKAKSETLKQAEEEADIAAEKVVKKPRIVRKPVVRKPVDRKLNK